MDLNVNEETVYRVEMTLNEADVEQISEWMHKTHRNPEYDELTNFLDWIISEVDN